MATIQPKMSSMQQDIAIDFIRDERNRQDELWGTQDHDDLYWLGILCEEVGEASKAIISELDDKELFNELTHIAAVAIAWMERKVVRKILAEDDE